MDHGTELSGTERSRRHPAGKKKPRFKGKKQSGEQEKNGSGKIPAEREGKTEREYRGLSLSGGKNSGIKRAVEKMKPQKTVIKRKQRL